MPLYSPPQVTIEDEGTGQGDAHTLNFVGAGVSASVAASEATITIAGGAGGAISEVSIPFTDGDTLRRVTVTDAGVSASSELASRRRRRPPWEVRERRRGRSAALRLLRPRCTDT